MADFLQEKQREIGERIAELKPLVEEYQRLQAADAALNGLSTTDASTRTAPRQSAPSRRGPGRPRSSSPGAAAATATAAPTAKRTSSRTGGGRRGRPKGGGKRAVEALSHITAQPGITIPELASKMRIKQNYLYRVLPTLQKAGSVVKRGKGWHPKSE